MKRKRIAYIIVGIIVALGLLWTFAAMKAGLFITDRHAAASNPHEESMEAFSKNKMTDNPINVAGIEIPSDSPVFLAVLGAHVLFGLASVVSGVGAMLSQKRPGRHPRFGTIYYYCLSVVFASATILSAMRWAEDYHLFILGSLSFGTASLGRMVIRRRLMCTLGALAALSSNSAAIAISRDSCFSLDSGPGSRLYNPL